MSARELFQLSLEAAAPDGSVTQEIEYAFFVKLSDFEQLKEAASSELQEQWQAFKDRGDGVQATIRVRAVNDKEFILCTKVKRPGVLGKEEVELPTTRDMFEHFKIFGDNGLRKTRYFYPVADSDLIWEVDVFENAQGEQIEWVKIDLEVSGPEVEVPAFPVKFTESILRQHGQRTEEENAFVADLFENQYSLTGQQ